MSNGNKRPFVDPLSGLQNDPVNPNIKRPPNPESLNVSSLMMVSGPQDVGDYFETESKYDKYITRSDLENIERERALMQPGGAKAFNALVGGIASGVMTAVEDIAYLGDLENNAKMLANLEHVEENFVSELMKKGKEALDKAMPIYRYSDKVFDWRDPGFYWSSVKGILDSAVGFAIPGMGVAKGVGAVQKSLRAMKYLEMFRGSKAVQQMINAGVSGVITNFAEGKMMAVEQFENSMKMFEEELLKENIEHYQQDESLSPKEVYSLAEQRTAEQLNGKEGEDFRTIAGEEADRFIKRNRMFALTDAIGLHSIYKGAGVTRNLLKDKKFSAAAKRLTRMSSDNLILQAFKEGGEEIGQNIIQMEGEYQSLERAGKDTSYAPEDLAARIYQFATSDKALLEGMMGLFGGAPQRIITEGLSGNLSLRPGAEYKKRYDQQQEMIKKSQDFLNAKLANYSIGQALRAEALRTGVDNLAEVEKNSEFIDIATEHFITQTTEVLERQLRDIANLTPEQAAERGFDPEYKQQANDQLKLMKELEKSFQRVTRYENPGDVFLNRENRKLLLNDKKIVEGNLQQVEDDIALQGDDVDQELLKTKKSYENWIQVINDRLKVLDESHKDLVSAKTQRTLREERKEDQKLIGQAIKKKREADKKKRKDEASKAREAKRNLKKKEEEKAREDVKEEAKDDADVDQIVEEDDEADVNILAKERKPKDDAMPDIKEEDVKPEEADVGDLDPDEAARIGEIINDFNGNAEELLKDIEDELGIQEVLVGDERQSPAQERLGRLELMMKNLEELTGKEKPSFEDLIELLLEQKGRERISKVFSRIEDVYKFYNPSHVSSGTLENYLTLSNEENKEDESTRKSTETNVKDQFSEATEQEIDDEVDKLDNEIASLNEEDASQGINYIKVRSGSGIIAYLSRKFRQTFHKNRAAREDIDNVLNEELEDKTILDLDKYTAGTEVTLKVEEDRDTKVYVPGTKTRERTTWGERSDKIKRETDNEETRDRLLLEGVPIAVYVGDQRIGYLHETEWINQLNVVGSDKHIEADKERNRRIRKYIKENGGVLKTKIAKRTTGYLFRTKGGVKVKTSEAFEDESLVMHVASEGELKSSRSKSYKGGLLNKKKYIEGAPYYILPLGDGKKIAVPLTPTKLSEREDIVNLLVEAIRIFMEEDTSEKANATVDAIKEITKGIDIRTNIGLADFLEIYVNNYNYGKAADLKTYLLNNTSKYQEDREFMAIRQRKDNDVYFEISKGRIVNHNFLTKKVWKNKNAELKAKVLQSIKDHFMGMYTHVSLDAIDNNTGVPLLNEDGSITGTTYKEHLREVTKSSLLGHNIAEEGKPPKYIYTIQSVITLDFSMVDGVKPEQKKKEEKRQDKEERKAATEKKEEFKKPVRKLKSGIDPNFIESSEEDPMIQEQSTVLEKEDVINMTDKSEYKIIDKDGNTEGIIISDLGDVKQRQIVDYLRAKVVDTLFKRGKVKTKRKTVFDRLRRELEADIQTLKDTDEKGYAKTIKELERIVRNWDKLVVMTSQQLERIDNIKVKPEEEGELTEEEENQNSENENWSDESQLTKNPVNGLAPEIKEFLSGITKYVQSEDGPVAERNYLGLPKYMDFQEVYNYLQRITPNLRPSFEEIAQAIRSQIDENSAETYFLKEVLEKLENADSQIKNQFVSGMTNHHVEMRFLMYKRKKDGSYELTDFNSNRNRIGQVIEANWYAKLVSNTAIPTVDGEYIIDDSTKDRLLAMYENFKKGKYTTDQLRAWLEEFGIVLSDATFNELIEGEINYKGQPASITKQIQFGLFAKLAGNLRERGNQTLENDKLLDQTVVRVLASREATHNVLGSTNSHRTGNKTVYSYGQNKYVVNRTRELIRFVEGNNELLDALSSLPFNGESGWIEELNKNGGENDFAKNLDYWVVSLEAMKKSKSKSKDNGQLHKLSEGEIEAFKMAMLQASQSDRANNNNRIIRVLFPTTSDKTTSVGLRVVATDISLDENGNLEDESIDTIVDRVVYPEIQRMKYHADRTNKDTLPDIKEFANGGSQFLFLPELNEIEELFDVDENGNRVISSFATSPDARGLIKEKVKEYVNSLVNEKMEFWKEVGIGEENNFIDGKYLNGDTVKGKNIKKNPLRRVNKEGKIRGAATDMVFQYLIANAETAMTYIGDPALFYKQAGVNKNKSRTDTDYDWVADSKETANNMGKRLAADVAPGTELAEAYDNNYTQGLLADSPSSSLAALQITKLLDGQEAYDHVKSQIEKLEKGEITRRQFVDSIGKYESAPYHAFSEYGFASTDAQEYTTWQEHLYVMKQTGEISDEDYTNAHFLLSMGRSLDKKLLGKVMQPMKPVYVENKIEDGTERKVYIKSSSFPLLPQLTKKTDLDNLRISMENQGIDRVAFSTAVKLGNIGNPINIFNEDGSIKKASEISFTNSKLNLNRSGFRIQQRVPYNSKTAEINKVTQASKNLLVNMLEVNGFSVPWIEEGKPVDGKKLQEEYHKVYDKLHMLKRDELLAEIEYDEETGRFNTEEVRKILMLEARERGYPISDQELIKLDGELRFLSFSGSAGKYEALLNSIVNNRVIKIMMPGKSYILGSEEGFVTRNKDYISSVEGITFTDRWTGELLPAREGKNGERLPAQALVPWKFRDKNGRVLNIEEYVIKKDGKLVIDNNKLPEELRYMFGMRIPNQGPNSQSWIEIVGFLPEASGDLFIGTKDYVVQMGSDFDVDKIYTYMYSTYVDSEGRIKKHEDEKKAKEQSLKNKILDVHIAIHKNPDPVVQSQIATPLGFWELKNYAENIVELREERQKTEGGVGTRQWARKSLNGYEVSSRGDKRFSAFNAKLSTGETIEQAYQRLKGTGKGKPAADPNFDYWGTYLGLWKQWADENPDLIEELSRLSKGKVLTDQFATTENNQAKALATILDEKFPIRRRKMFTHLSDAYQREKFKNATAGKDGVSVFSLDSMFNAVAQGKNLRYMVPNPERGEGEPAFIPLYINIGGKESFGELSAERALDEKTYKSDIIAGYQSGSVDNEKEQILDKLNVNSHTFKAIKILNQLGYGEEVPYFIAQDIIIDYVKELENLSGHLSGYVPDREQKAFENVIKSDKYKLRENDKYDPALGSEKATVAKLKEYIEKGDKAPNYRAAQIAILEEFRRFTKYGQEIQKLQSTINPDSAGLGKSTLESTMKEDQVYELLDSRIENASRLIGDIIQINNADIAKYEAKGYTVKRRPDATYAIKSNTINGHAIVYGLFTANELWGDLFDYNDDNMKMVFEKVESLIGKDDDGFIRRKADRRYDIWKAVKSYIFSDDALGLHDTTVTEERERLLYDRFKLGEDGESKIRTSQSLASFIDKLKSTNFGRNNPLISRLTPVVHTNGTPSTIEYNASSGMGVDETGIYSAFADAFTRKDSDGNSPKIGEFEGNENYTLRDLAQDLVLYAYITGGVQEAKQFVRYVPVSYLDTIPFISNLRDIDYGVSGFVGDFVSDNVLLEYYNIPDFAEQYVQHNPDEVPLVDEKKHIQGKEKRVFKLQKFKLNQDGLDRVGKDVTGDGEPNYPPYVTLRGGYSSSGLLLYKFDTKTKEYVQIDTLGSNGTLEYNKGAKTQTSLNVHNKSRVPTDERPKGPTTTETFEGTPEDVEQKTDEDTFLDRLRRGAVPLSDFEDGKAKTTEILEGIINNSRNPYYSALAEEFLAQIDRLPNNMSVNVVPKQPSIDGVGYWAYMDSEKYGLKVSSLNLVKPALKGYTANQIESTFLHELTHAFTGTKAALYDYTYGERKNDSDAKDRIAGIQKSNPGIELSEREKKIYDSISTLMKLARVKIEADPKKKKELDDIRKGYKKTLSKTEFDEYYGLSDVSEFITMAMTHKPFQDFLNGITVNKKKTVWQSLKDKIVALLDALKINVDKNSVLYHTIHDVLDLIEQPTEEEIAQEEEKEQQEEGEMKTRIFKIPEDGNYYKFLFDEEGNVVKGYYSPGNLNNWKPLKAKNVVKKYEQLLKASEEDETKELKPQTAEKDNQMTLPGGKVITFNEQQYDALLEIDEWVKSDDMFFTLSGFAGTGKTTIIRKAIETSLAGRKIAVSAPTHKAKKVIAATTDLEAYTIHSLLNLKPFIDPQELNPENAEFAEDKNSKFPPAISKYSVIVIDEASMLNKTLFNLIVEKARQYGTRIIFMGDQAQIPPVGELQSEVFTSDLIGRKAHLDKVERQADGNPLFKIYDAIRNNISSETDQYKHVTNINDRGEGVQFMDNQSDFYDKAIELFTSKEYEENPDMYKLIAYRNKTVTAWNEAIRRVRMGKDAEQVEQGDVLTGNDTVFRGNESVVVENSADYVVLDRSELKTNSYGIEGYRVRIKFTDAEGTSDIFIVNNTEENLGKVKEQLRKLHGNAVTGVGRWREYYAFKENNILMQPVSFMAVTNKRITVKKQIDYGYAITSHKSQGSTYDTVLIDENDVDTRKFWKERDETERIKKGLTPLTKEDIDTERNKLKYVAFSRPSKKVIALSKKTTAQKNTAVDPAVEIPTEIERGKDPNVDDAGFPTVEDLTNINNNDPDVSDLLKGDNKDLPPIPPGFLAPNFVPAETFVSDEDLDAYIKQCKG